MRPGRFFLKPFLGKRQFQPIFEMMYKVGLAGMNVGEGGMPDQSGESWVLDFIHSRLSRNTDAPIVFDVGANAGQFATSVLHVFGAKTKLWSFEPSRTTFVKLEKALGGRSNVTLVNSAVGATEGEVEMFSPAPGSKLASIYERSSTWENSAREVVPLVALDGYCTKHGINKIDFLKIDVEGHELAVLHGAKGLLQAKGIHFIQFEFSAAHIDARVFFRDFYALLKNQFSIYRILQNGLKEVKEYNPELELFKRATNYLAIRKD